MTKNATSNKPQISIISGITAAYLLGPAIYSVNYSIPLLPTWQIYGRQKVARNKRKLWLSIMSCHLSNNSAKNDGTKTQIAGHRGYSNQVTTHHLKIALPMMVPPGRRCLTGYSNQIITPPFPPSNRKLLDINEDPLTTRTTSQSSKIQRCSCLALASSSGVIFGIFRMTRISSADLPMSEHDTWRQVRSRRGSTEWKGRGREQIPD
jgi:hypothetical protein